MIDLIIHMFRSPDDQVDPYIWAAALLGHFAIGAFLTALVGWFVGPWWAVFWVATLYLILWEGSQIAAFGGTFRDALVDGCAVACGSVAAAGAWEHAVFAIASAFVVMLGLMGRGLRRRD